MSETLWFAFMMAAGAWVMVIAIVIYQIQQKQKIENMEELLKYVERRMEIISMSPEERTLRDNVGDGAMYEQSPLDLSEEVMEALSTVLSRRGLTAEEASRILNNFNENMMPELEMLQEPEEEPDHEPIIPENIRRRSRKINRNK